MMTEVHTVSIVAKNKYSGRAGVRAPTKVRLADHTSRYGPKLAGMIAAAYRAASRTVHYRPLRLTGRCRFPLCTFWKVFAIDAISLSQSGLARLPHRHRRFSNHPRT